MRLIDADDYCENICRCNREACDKSKCPICTAPTAYDVDNVTKELEQLCRINFEAWEKSEWVPDKTAYINKARAYNKAIKIVKAGKTDG